MPVLRWLVAPLLLGACTGEIDPGSTRLPFGAACSSGSECASTRCNAGRCSSCADNADCPPTSACRFSEVDQYHVCANDQGRVLGEPCTTGVECASGRCFESRICSACEESTAHCGAGESCTWDDGLGYARCQDGRAALGVACGAPAACTSGHCRDGVCALCTDDADCTEATCTFVAGDGYARCVPWPGALGQPCASDAECASGACFAPGGGYGEVCSLCKDASTCGGNRDCMFDPAVGYGACRGTLALGAGCGDDGECLSAICNATRCSLCADDADCFNGTHCAHKLPEDYALCFDTAEERVNADFSADGTFERVGCNGDCNGCTCDANGDGAADGYCVGDDCATPAWDAPVVLDCDLDDCSSSDHTRSAFLTCVGHSGLACSTTLATAPTFEQEGVCACFGGGACQCQAAGAAGGGHDVLCLDGEVVVHGTEPACQVDGTPCDDTYVGNFDPGYGTTSSGTCQPAVCAEPRVDVARDGSFTWCGCDYVAQGLLCHLNGDPGARGLCAVDECVLTPPVARDCWRDDCTGVVERGCVRGGQACDASFLRSGQLAFVHEGFCADAGGGLACVTHGAVCRATDASFHAGCGGCADGAACDATLTDGAFDGSYGACSGGACVAHVYPAVFDWRDHAGGNWTTPVANQQQVGACTVFAAVSAIEARWNIQNGMPGLDINLAEQEPVSCGGWSVAGSSVTLSYAESTGIPDEACFPWANDEDTPCDNRCSDAADRRWKISGASPVERHSNYARLAIQSTGPVVATMLAGGMAKDGSGIYYCPSLTGGHAVAVVGWNDVDGYWIVKNSWGASWNPSELGFFRLRYGECSLAFDRAVDGVLAP